MAKSLTLHISFKNTTRDMKLYLYVKDQEEQSEFVKDAIENYIKIVEKKKKRNK